MWEIPTHFFVDTIRGNCIYKRNAVKSESDYTAEQLEELYNGNEIPVEWDEETREPIEWECLSEEEEDYV